MSLFQNTLQDPTQLFASDSDSADRLASMQRMFTRIGLMKPAHSGDTVPSVASPSALSSFRLGTGLPPAFNAPAPAGGHRGFARRAGPQSPPPMQGIGRNGVYDDMQNNNADLMSHIGDAHLGGPNSDDDLMSSIRARIAALSATDPNYNPSTANNNPISALPYQPRYMTPMEGPDIGAINPNVDGTAGAPAGYFSHLRGTESTSRPGAVNPVTGAAGLYQFLPSTWSSMRKEAPQLGLTDEGIKNPTSEEGQRQQDAAAHYYTAKSMGLLSGALGRSPTAGELYALHLLGHAGGMNVIQNPDKPVASTVSAAAIQANPWLKPLATKPGYALLDRLDAMMSQN